MARETKVEEAARRYKPWSHVVVLLFAQLTHSLGLNDVCDALGLHSGPVLTKNPVHGPGWCYRHAPAHGRRVAGSFPVAFQGPGKAPHCASPCGGNWRSSSTGGRAPDWQPLIVYSGCSCAVPGATGPMRSSSWSRTRSCSGICRASSASGVGNPGPNEWVVRGFPGRFKN